MSLYREENVTETVTKTRFVRANLITIDYPNKLSPSITFVEEQIERRDGVDASLGHVGECSETLLPGNVGEQFSLLDPQTGSVIGAATYGDVQVLLYSLYFHIASKRDAAEASA